MQMNLKVESTMFESFIGHVCHTVARFFLADSLWLKPK